MPGAVLLSFGLVDGHAIFVDDRNDAYFQLGSEEEAGFLKEIATRSSVPAGELSCASAIGFGDVQIVRADAPAPCGSLLDELPLLGHPSVGDVLRAGTLMLRARLEIARRPISSILSSLTAERPAGEARAAPTSLAGKAQKFLAARRLFPFSPNCLSDSLALLRWLGPAPRLRLIFGVKLDPFAAHCWVQLNELLINERPDVIEAFRPVRVIECTPATR